MSNKHTQDQWQRKKQTKEQARAARMAKLDPENAKSAKDILDEQVANERKRKREEDGDKSDSERVEREKPISDSAKKRKQTKKQKREEKGVATSLHNPTDKLNRDIQSGDTQNDEIIAKEKAAKRREKRRRKKEAKAEASAFKAKAKAEKKAQERAEKKTQQKPLAKDSKNAADFLDSSEDDDEASAGADIGPITMEDIDEIPSHPSPSTSTLSTSRSPAFDASNPHSGSSSISSMAPPANGEVNAGEVKTSTHQSTFHKPKPEQLKARLIDRIEALRAARHPAGAPAKNRQELMEQRRAKEEQRRAHKKELRRQAKEEEERQRIDTLTRGSPLLSGTPLHSPGSPLTPSSESNSFSFGRINFSNGQCLASNLSSVLNDKSKAKGPSDPHTALLAAQKKQSRLNSFDETKCADIAEKDDWLNARKRAHGERTRDDTSLLKKTLKRKEKQKKKSEKEWNERIEGVKKGQDFKQKKREANLQKRKEEKGSKGSKKSGEGGAAKKGKPKARPGFEGSFRTKAPSAVAGSAGGENGPRRR